MPTITFNGESFVVDHAVEGDDFVHGYDAAGNCIVSLDGIRDMGEVTYDGDYMRLRECLAEPGNTVKYCGGSLRTADGGFVQTWNLIWENASPDSSFGSQTITIEGLSEYNLFIITARVSSTHTHTFNTLCYRPELEAKKVDLTRFDGSSGAWAAWERDATIDRTNETVAFSNGLYSYSGNSRNSTYTAVPIYILATKI